MVAFEIYGWPIYRYGIMYVLSFLGGYVYLSWLGKRPRIAEYPRLHYVLSHALDDVLMMIVLGVLLGGRLGDVFLYNRSYYSAHMSDILAVWKGGMSFVGGFIGVAIAMFVCQWRYKLTIQELFLLFDAIVFFLPMGILFGRVGNGLNQELYGKVLDSASYSLLKLDILRDLHLVRIYDKIDNQIRRNTNLLEGFFEGLVLWVFHVVWFGKKIIRGLYRPGVITGVFCVLYAIIRFILESLRDNPPSEYIHGLLKSQILMGCMMLLGVGILGLSHRRTLKTTGETGQ